MKVWLCISFILLGSAAWADEETRAAVQEVQKQMHSPKFHQDAAKTSPEASQVQDQVKKLAGSAENEQEIYNLAAEVLGNMKDQNPDEMIKLLQEAQRNPEAFAKNWTPEQKKKLKELSDRLPAASAQKKP